MLEESIGGVLGRESRGVEEEIEEQVEEDIEKEVERQVEEERRWVEVMPREGHG